MMPSKPPLETNDGAQLDQMTPQAFCKSLQPCQTPAQDGWEVAACISSFTECRPSTKKRNRARLSRPNSEVQGLNTYMSESTKNPFVKGGTGDREFGDSQPNCAKPARCVACRSVGQYLQRSRPGRDIVGRSSRFVRPRGSWIG